MISSLAPAHFTLTPPPSNATPEAAPVPILVPEPAHQGVRIRGLMADKTAGPGHVLMSIPESCLITYGTALESDLVSVALHVHGLLTATNWPLLGQLHVHCIIMPPVENSQHSVAPGTNADARTMSSDSCIFTLGILLSGRLVPPTCAHWRSRLLAHHDVAHASLLPSRCARRVPFLSASQAWTRSLRRCCGP